jgi:alpha-galactosidase
MAHFIRDVRKDLSAPDMKFVIGVMGVGGPLEKYESKRYVGIHGNFRAAMAAPAVMPEFKGNVAAVQTALCWDLQLGAMEGKRGKVGQMSRFLRTKHKDHANKDGKMTPKEQKEYMEKYRVEIISAEDEARWKRGASNAGYHYLGCGKTMALIGKAFADAMLEMEGIKTSD